MKSYIVYYVMKKENGELESVSCVCENHRSARKLIKRLNAIDYVVRVVLECKEICKGN